MSTMMPNTIRVLAHLGQGFAVWLERANSRNELRNFGDAGPAGHRPVPCGGEPRSDQAVFNPLGFRNSFIRWR